MQKFLCPKCGKRSLRKEEVEEKKYIFICSECGFKQRTPLKDDKKKGIV
jgi:predicted RNA-binding Zn-ribbon protein involved in translation (DUF1610 family)